MKTRLLGEMLAELACGAIGAQERFDEAHDGELARFWRLWSEAPEPMRGFLRALAPARTGLSEMELALDCDIGVRREVELRAGTSYGALAGALEALPVNLSVMARFGRSEQQRQSLAIVIQQVPAADHQRPSNPQ